MKNIYEHFKANPPVDADGNRKRGNSSQDAYWTGFDFPDRNPRGEVGSNARLAWEAGKLMNGCDSAWPCFQKEQA
jgi:hypothetical protein